MTQAQRVIPAACNLPSHRVDVHGAQMHYLELGEGDPILFLHGMPTSSYLWRNIMPAFADLGRCIAVDLIGMGQSDKPEVEYTIHDHIKYINGFIDKLNLKNITLVMHGWGSVIGFDYAMRNEDNVKALAFYEAHIRANVEWEMLSLPIQQLATLLNRPGASYRAIVEHNYLIRKLLPHGVLRKLTDEEMAHYEEPFLTPESRKPLWQYILELPLGTTDGPAVDIIETYSSWLQKSALPKLLMYAMPGFTTTIDTVQWAKTNIPELTISELPDALHFAQESMPDEFSKVLRDWFVESVKE